MDNITRKLNKVNLEKKILKLISEFEEKWDVVLDDISYDTINSLPRNGTIGIYTKFII